MCQKRKRVFLLIERVFLIVSLLYFVMDLIKDGKVKKAVEDLATHLLTPIEKSSTFV